MTHPRRRKAPVVSAVAAAYHRVKAAAAERGRAAGRAVVLQVPVVHCVGVGGQHSHLVAGGVPAVQC
eukprot:CAMPEP_0175123568 /NCGR_PEP_ID=MMETSP0087-20121206/2315_1 /TAXON_ID=136419 /ORGANISM="Unknown Unknown, Strain D1" /LENGTH=66 /DNA_ID=CAMNT_0016405273 /DNA_START=802 /DNA_END=1002 /DNA_ORIENTATION=-